MLNNTEITYLRFVKQLCGMKRVLETRKRSFPEGGIIESRRRDTGKTEFYRFITAGGRTERKFLSPRKDAELISALREKRKALPAIEREISELEILISEGRRRAEKLLASVEPIPFDKKPHPSKKPTRRNDLKYKTLRGEMVRSFNEKSIADFLYVNKINYDYEWPLTIDGVTLYPDFTVTDPYTGQIYYWEHLGMDGEDKSVDWENRKDYYARINVTPQTNLIVTREEDINRLDEIVARHLFRENWTEDMR